MHCFQQQCYAGHEELVILKVTKLIPGDMFWCHASKNYSDKWKSIYVVISAIRNANSVKIALVWSGGYIDDWSPTIDCRVTVINR